MDCGSLSGNEKATVVATGNSKISIATVQLGAGIIDPEFATSGSSNATVGIVIAGYQGQASSDSGIGAIFAVSYADCQVAAGKPQQCTQALELFAAQIYTQRAKYQAADYPKSSLAKIDQSIAAATAAASKQLVAAPSAPQKACSPQRSLAPGDQTLPAVPTTTSPLAGVTLPKALSYFGVPNYDFGDPVSRGEPAALTFVGPTDFVCSALGGGDGSLTATLSDALDKHAYVNAAFAIGGQGNLDSAFCFTLDEAGPSERSALDALVKDQVCNNTDLGAAAQLIKVSQLLPVVGVKQKLLLTDIPANFGDAGSQAPSAYDGLDLSIFDDSPGHEDLLDINCALPSVDRFECGTILRAFAVAQLSRPFHVPPRIAAAAAAAVAAAVATSTAPAAQAAIDQSADAKIDADAKADCAGLPLSLGLENDLKSFQSKKFSIPTPHISTTGLSSLTVSASFTVLGFHACEKNLKGTTVNPPVFAPPDLRLQIADDKEQVPEGPFEYDAPLLSWKYLSGMPVGQDLKTHFKADIGVEFAPSLGLTYDISELAKGEGKPKVSLSIGSIKLTALEYKVRLVDSGGALLEATAAPGLELGVSVSPQDVKEKAQEAEAEGDDEGTAIERAAEDAGAEAGEAVTTEAEELFGVDVSSAAAEMAVGYETAIRSGLVTDPELTIKPAAPDQGLAEDEFGDAPVGALDEAGIDALGGEALAGSGESIGLVDFLSAFLEFAPLAIL